MLVLVCMVQEEYRARVVEEARRRLLEEHAPALADYLPKVRTNHHYSRRRSYKPNLLVTPTTLWAWGSWVARVSALLGLVPRMHPTTTG